MSDHIDDSTTDAEIEAVVERDRIRREMRDANVAAGIDRDVARKEQDQIVREFYQGAWQTAAVYSSRYAIDMEQRIARAREILLATIHVHQPTAEEVLRAIEVLEGKVSVHMGTVPDLDARIRELEKLNDTQAKYITSSQQRISKTHEVLMTLLANYPEVPIGPALQALEEK